MLRIAYFDPGTCKRKAYPEPDIRMTRIRVNGASDENRAGVQWLLGMTQYLAKFLPNLSDLTKPLRDLTKKDVVFTWDAPQDAVFGKLKLEEAITQCQ